MTTPTPPADAIWGIRWEVPVLPDNDPDVPVQPQQPDAPGDDPVWQEYNTALSQWYQDILALIAIHPEWWREVVTVASSETHARCEFINLAEANGNNAFTRNTELVWSAPTVWTAAE